MYIVRVSSNDAGTPLHPERFVLSKVPLPPQAQFTDAERFFAWISRNRRLRKGRNPLRQGFPLRRIHHGLSSEAFCPRFMNCRTDSKRRFPRRLLGLISHPVRQPARALYIVGTGTRRSKAQWWLQA
jgi:hypothetical protein